MGIIVGSTFFFKGELGKSLRKIKIIKNKKKKLRKSCFPLNKVSF